MEERDGDLGYIAIRPQVTKLAVVGIPNVYLPIYNFDVATDPGFQGQNPIVGSKFKSRNTLRGPRSHSGSMVLEGEPVAAAYAFASLLTRGTESGSAPSYTNTYGLSKVTNPIYYTADVSFVSHVIRYIGLTTSSIAIEWESDEMRLNCAVSCLKVWDGREVASVAGQIITLKQDYDRRPSDGLFTGDTLQIFDVSAQAYINVTVSTLNANGIDVTVTGTITAITGGDFITIRPAASPSYSSGPAFQFTNTEYRFADTAANALTATHTPLEDSTSLTLTHEFKDDGGEHRSGSRDPASLPRLQGTYEFSPTVYFDKPEELERYSNMVKRACVARHFSYTPAGVTYELRVTMNNMTQGNPLPSLESEAILYSSITMFPNADATDGQGMGVTVIGPATLG